MSLLSRRGRRIVGALLLVLVLGTPLAFARAHFLVFNEPGEPLDPFTDAYTYLAAGERLNAGHELYRLQEGDRPVLIIPDLFTQPLVSPPPIAVLWRPIAAIPFGVEAWIVACWVALLGTVAYLVLRVGLPAALLALVLSLPIGEELAVANVVSFFPAVLVLAWRHRAHAWIGIPLGLIAAVKLAPVAVVGWLIAERRYRALAAFGVTLVVLALVSVAGAGINSFSEYLAVVPTLRPSPLSLAGQTGISWLSYAALAVGIALSASMRSRPRLAYCVAVVTLVLGTPVIYYGGLVVLLALAAPLLPEPGEATVVSAASAGSSGTGPDQPTQPVPDASFMSRDQWKVQPE
jgi:Glycosyltransferase family 87